MHEDGNGQGQGWILTGCLSARWESLVNEKQPSNLSSVYVPRHFGSPARCPALGGASCPSTSTTLGACCAISINERVVFAVTLDSLFLS
jgi:hypothetical protein